MAKAFICDMCGNFTELINHVSGVDFKIGEYHDEFTGIHARVHEVHDMCNDCYKQIREKIIEIYQQNQKEEK